MRKYIKLEGNYNGSKDDNQKIIPWKSIKLITDKSLNNEKEFLSLFREYIKLSKGEAPKTRTLK